jgi:hypothetical protein
MLDIIQTDSLQSLIYRRHYGSGISNCGSGYDDDFFLFSFEGGFNTQGNEETSGQELFSPLLRFPGDSVTNLYKKMTEERLIIEVEGM